VSRSPHSFPYAASNRYYNSPASPSDRLVGAAAPDPGRIHHGLSVLATVAAELAAVGKPRRDDPHRALTAVLAALDDGRVARPPLAAPARGRASPLARSGVRT
jgi:hypothetical protein